MKWNRILDTDSISLSAKRIFWRLIESNSVNCESERGFTKEATSPGRVARPSLFPMKPSIGNEHLLDRRQSKKRILSLVISSIWAVFGGTYNVLMAWEIWGVTIFVQHRLALRDGATTE
jgi:hypothetical protein